jgi:hypothetical protein
MIKYPEAFWLHTLIRKCRGQNVVPLSKKKYSEVLRCCDWLAQTNLLLSRMIIEAPLD